MTGQMRLRPFPALGVLVVALMALAAAPAFAIVTLRPASVQTKFDALDSRLTDALAVDLIAHLPDPAAQSVPSLGVLAVDRADVRVPKALADKLTALLSQSLIDVGQGRFSLVSKDVLGIAAPPPPGTDPRRRAIEVLRQAGAGILMIGEVTVVEPALYRLQYRALDLSNGALLGYSQERTVRFATPQAIASDIYPDPVTAAQAAAAALAVDPAFRLLAVDGLFFEDSSVQSPFGHQVADLMVSALSDALAEQGRRLRLVRPQLEIRGLSIVAKAVAPADPDRPAPPQPFHLQGRYWPVKDMVEVNLQLFGPGGTVETWRGRIPRAAIDRAIEPDKDLSAVTKNDALGPVGITLTSDRGIDPVYELGETMSLLVSLDRDAYLTCYYQQADGTTLQIMPNPFAPGNYFYAGEPFKVPDARMPFQFDLVPPTGTELVKCFATSRYVLEELPEPFRNPGLESLGTDRIADLVSLYRDLRNTFLSEASLTINVRAPAPVDEAALQP